MSRGGMELQFERRTTSFKNKRSPYAPRQWENLSQDVFEFAILLEGVSFQIVILKFRCCLAEACSAALRVACFELDHLETRCQQQRQQLRTCMASSTPMTTSLSLFGSSPSLWLRLRSSSWRSRRPSMLIGGRPWMWCALHAWVLDQVGCIPHCLPIIWLDYYRPSADGWILLFPLCC